jgi:signal transduction histidine kinase
LATVSTSPDEPFTLVLTEGHTLLFGAPLDDGTGWLVGGLPIETLPFAELLDTSYLGSTGAIMLVDRNKRVLYAAGPWLTDTTIDHQPGVTQGLAGESGVLFEPHPRGEHVIAYAPIAGVDWALVLSEPWEPLAAPLLRIDQVMPFVLITAAATSLLTLLFGLRYVVRPLQKLDAQANRIGLGDFDAAGDPTGGVKEIEDLRRTLDRMAHQVQRYQAALEDYLGALTDAQEEERARLARELHDETVQTLIALSQRAQMIQRALVSDPDRAAERLTELRTMIGEAVEEVRRFSRALRPLYLEELGLVPALEMLAREAGAVFWINGSTRRLVGDQELALYRIAQEALSNAQRHAQARQTNMSLTFVEEGVTLRVQDDGTGFPVPDRFTDLARSGHFGLLGMHERAQRAGGRLTISSAAGHGTVVEVWLASDSHSTPSHN